MRNPTAKRHDHPPVMEAPAVADHTAVQQICHWAMAHKLQAHRVCSGFRLHELGLAELVSAVRSTRPSLGSS
jgi:hypothetical protein